VGTSKKPPQVRKFFRRRGDAGLDRFKHRNTIQNFEMRIQNGNQAVFHLRKLGTYFSDMKTCCEFFCKVSEKLCAQFVRVILPLSKGCAPDFSILLKF
jgi:hypothetical protein